jgi:hypothetical protein
MVRFSRFTRWKCENEQTSSSWWLRFCWYWFYLFASACGAGWQCHSPPPFSISPCSADAGIGEVNAVSACTNGSAKAVWPPPGVIGSDVAGSASVTVTGNQSITATATLDQVGGPVAMASADATLIYYIQINPTGLPGSGSDGVNIPIYFLSGSTLDAPIAFASLGNNASDSASTSLTIQTAGSPFNGSTQYQVNKTTGSTGNLGAQDLSGYISLVSGAAYEITLSAYADIENQTGSDTASIDPYFSFVNSADASQYEIDFSPGITNGVSATPLPATLSLFACGLGMIGLLARRRKRNAAALEAA